MQRVSSSTSVEVEDDSGRSLGRHRGTEGLRSPRPACPLGDSKDVLSITKRLEVYIQILYANNIPKNCSV